MILGMVVSTNWIAPEAISGWRGAGLLYPSRTRLWSQRLGLAAFPAIVIGYVAFVFLLL